MTGPITHRFEVVLRPLRDKEGARQTVFLNTRTAAQATREATARWPEMKVVSVTRVRASVSDITPQDEPAEARRRAGGEGH